MHEDIPEGIIKEKVLDILELANGFGADIQTKEIKETKAGDKFFATYKGDRKGEPATDKKTAKKNLVYNLLEPLWENLREKQKRAAKQKLGPVGAKGKINLAPSFPQEKHWSSPSSSSGAKSTHFSSSSSSQAIQVRPNGLAKFGELAISPSLKMENRRASFGDLRGFKEHAAVSLSSPIDQTEIANVSIPDINKKVCSICLMDRRRNKWPKPFYQQFKNCIHTQLICFTCHDGYLKMRKAKRSKEINICPHCYYLDFAKKTEGMAKDYEDVKSFDSYKKDKGSFDPFATAGISKDTTVGEGEAGSRKIVSELASHLIMSESPNLSAGISNSKYEPYFRGDPGEIGGEEEPRETETIPTFTLDDVKRD